MKIPRDMLCVGGSKHGQFVEVGAPTEINLRDLDEPKPATDDITETYTVTFTPDGKCYGLHEATKSGESA